MGYSLWSTAHRDGSVIIDNANRRAYGNVSDDRCVLGTIEKTTGKWYFEVYLEVAGYNGAVGVASNINSRTSQQRSTILNGHGGSPYAWVYRHNGQKYNNGTLADYGAAFTNEVCTISIAIDIPNGKIWAAKNGTWQNSGNPATGANEMYSGLTGALRPLSTYRMSASTGVIIRSNVSQCLYTPPSGFLHLETLVTIGNNATLDSGAAVTAVHLLDADTLELVATATPATNGDWTALVPAGDYFVYYFSTTGYPTIHGKYTVTP